MLVGYARTSTIEQAAGLAAQKRDLKAASCEKIFAEQVSSVAARAKLTAALESHRVSGPPLPSVAGSFTNRSLGPVLN